MKKNKLERIIIASALIIFIIIIDILAYIENNKFTSVEVSIIPKLEVIPIKIEINTINKLLAIDKSLFISYINGAKNKTIKNLIKEELENEYYYLLNNSVPNDIVRDALESSILYVFTTDKNRMIFKNSIDYRTRIKKITSMLLAIAKIETGIQFKYNYRIFSRTGAYGRYQVIPTTLTSIALELELKNILKFSEFKYEKEKTFFQLYQKYSKNDYFLYKDKLVQKIVQNVQTNRYLKFCKMMNKKYDFFLNKRLNHMKYSNKNTFEFLNKQLKKNTYSRYDYSSKILDFMRDPVNQGYVSLFILEDIYNRENNKSNNEAVLVFNTLKYYNNDRRIVSNKEYRNIYADFSSKVYYSYLQ